MMWVTHAGRRGGAAQRRAHRRDGLARLAAAARPSRVVLVLRDLAMLAARSATCSGAAGAIAELNAVQESAALEIRMSIIYAALPMGAALIMLMLVAGAPRRRCVPQPRRRPTRSEAPWAWSNSLPPDRGPAAAGGADRLRPHPRGGGSSIVWNGGINLMIVPQQVLGGIDSLAAARDAVLPARRRPDDARAA